MLTRVLGAAILAASVLSAQDTSSDVLEQARDKILKSIRHLPNYTCLETIDRIYYAGPATKLSRHVMTEAPSPASVCSASGGAKPFRDASDRLRIEVAVAGKYEIHSWPGASRFDTRSIEQIVPFGPMSTGSFGGYLSGIFFNPSPEIKFIGKKNDGARDVFEYSFRVPLAASHYSVKGESGWKDTGYSGSFEINEATAELAKLVIETDQLPPDTGMCHTKTTLDYHFILIGHDEFLIPRRSQLETFGIDGGATDSVTAFSACHEYTAESSIRFDDPVGSGNSVTTAPKVVAALPSGISMTLALIGGIDAQSAAGDPVYARVTKTIRAPDSKSVLVSAGAIAHGRILQMRYEYKTSEYVIGIRFDTLDINGAVLPLSLKPGRELKPDSRESRGFVRRGAEFSLPSTVSVETGALIRVPAPLRGPVIPAGWEWAWVTVAQ
jgi:hypothetical protein